MRLYFVKLSNLKLNFDRFCLFLALVLPNANVGQGTVLKFKAPNLTEEEAHGKFMPDNLACDACTAIAHQVYKKFTTFSNTYKHFKYNLPESEVVDLVESACANNLYEGYGIKEHNGINRLHGPGLKDTENVPGMTAGGGKWPGRLTEMCWKFIDLIGEEGIYRAYRERKESEKLFSEYLCLGEASEGRSSCVGVTKDKKEL